MPVEINLGDLMCDLYDQFLELYGDEELASVATAAAINEIIAEHEWAKTHGLEHAA